MPEVKTNQITNTLTSEQLHEMILTCSTTEDGENLKNAMRDLKVALKQNPEACAAMLDEDIGLCVSALRRMTGQQITQEAAALAAKGRKPKIDLSDPKVAKDVEDNLFDGI